MANMLETAALRLEFDGAAGGLTAITNKLTGETYAVTGDGFAVETTAFRRTQAEMRQRSLKARDRRRSSTPAGQNSRGPMPLSRSWRAARRLMTST